MSNDQSPPPEQLRALAGTISHRGPDGQGIWASEGVGLAHCRLSIIDLSPAGAQPMLDGSETIVGSYNGEIYNYRDLRSELESAGVEFRTQTDTEVILAGYRLWGKEVLRRLRGMFAFALWNTVTRELLLARDRTGKKPLFYAITTDGHLVFASELKALRSFVPLTPDPASIRLYLGLQYVPAPLTGFQGVAQLRPGEFAVWNRGRFTTEKYHRWRPDHVPSSLRERDERLLDLLGDAVRVRQLASDVPVGAFLSGGVDSAAVVALASQHVSRLQTFTMGFDVPSRDERSEARAVASHFRTDHHEYIATANDLADTADDLIEHYDAPYADSSALPLWLLARMTAQHVKVVLTGDGSDELFGGYNRYVAYQRALRLARLPAIGGAVAATTVRLGGLLHDARLDRFGRVVETFRHDAARAYGELFTGSYFNTHDLSEACTPDFVAATDSTDAVSFIAGAMGGRTDLAAAMRVDFESYLPDDLNVKMDRATMRFGLEARSPFLDQEVVAFALGLPSNDKVAHGQTKIALKRALRGLVPDEALNRRKRGFQVPLAEWFRGPLDQTFRDRCLAPGSPLHAIVRQDVIERLMSETKRGADHGNRLWMLFALGTWLSRHKGA